MFRHLFLCQSYSRWSFFRRVGTDRSLLSAVSSLMLAQPTKQKKNFFLAFPPLNAALLAGNVESCQFGSKEDEDAPRSELIVQSNDDCRDTFTDLHHSSLW